MATEAQKRARRDFVNRFAYGLGRGVARVKHERARTISVGRGARKTKTQEFKGLRTGIAFLVGVGEGVSRRKKQQVAAAKKAAQRATRRMPGSK